MIPITVRGRQEGKTTEIIEWVLEGHPIPAYPFWSRIVRTHSIQEGVRIWDILRPRLEELTGPQMPPFIVYTHNERIVGQHPSVEVGIDNLDLYLAQKFGNVGLVTMTGNPVD
jgi:hypothetical protein